MVEIDYDEKVSLSIGGEPGRQVSLAEAIREIIAIPQKRDGTHAVVLGDGASLADYAAIVSVYERPDFPE